MQVERGEALRARMLAAGAAGALIAGVHARTPPSDVQGVVRCLRRLMVGGGGVYVPAVAGVLAAMRGVAAGCANAVTVALLALCGAAEVGPG